MEQILQKSRYTCARFLQMCRKSIIYANFAFKGSLPSLCNMLLSSHSNKIEERKKPEANSKFALLNRGWLESTGKNIV